MKRPVKTLKLIERQAAHFKVPVVTVVSQKNDPFRVLVSCILSLRTKDKTTVEASARLFKAADTPQKMLRLPVRIIERLIYPVGFYRNKARVLLGLSRKLMDEFGAKVPRTLLELLEFKGVGRKTANLVLGLGYNIPAICVDTHVHRISNRLGWIKTRVPEETEEALMSIFPRKKWIEINTILVTFGQNICVPISPFCSRCAVGKVCKRVGVSRSR
ncbi:MAG: endonuclease III [Candidatus Omnitrophica bacterium]|nr:endonuclease III [Candidatus Omnitrophota bacterium]